jgi:nucleoside-diphosphate-sugar epimerase
VTKCVLVTGATGFIGRHAVRALATRGFVVHGVARTPGSDERVTWHRADLLDSDAIVRVVERVRPSHLLHLAWVTNHGRYWTAPENLAWAETTLRLWRRFCGAGGQRAVGAGTCAEYSWSTQAIGGLPLEEFRTPRSPRHFYGVAKNATFELLSAYASSVELRFAWGRVFFPYGADDRPTLVPSIIDAIRAGRPAPCTPGRQQRDFIHVRDAAEAFAALLDSDVEGPVNIATGIATSIAEVATRLGALLGRPELIHLGALQPRPDEPPSLVADVRRLREDVGFVPKISLDEGLRETIERSPGLGKP